MGKRPSPGGSGYVFPSSGMRSVRRKEIERPSPRVSVSCERVMRFMVLLTKPAYPASHRAKNDRPNPWLSAHLRKIDRKGCDRFAVAIVVSSDRVSARYR